MRKERRSKGATGFRDLADADCARVIFDWNPQGFKQFVSGLAAPPILHEVRPIGGSQAATLIGEYKS